MARAAVLGLLTRLPVTKQAVAGRLSQIDIAYPRASREDHRMVGKRMPDVDCGGSRLYELLRQGRFVLVAAEDVDVDGSDVVAAVHRDAKLPAAVLVRPDGYVAWADDRPPTASHAAAAVARWTR